MEKENIRGGNLLGQDGRGRIYEEKEEYVLEKENIWGGNLFGQGWRRRIYEEKEEYVLEKEKFLWVGPRDMTTCKG